MDNLPENHRAKWTKKEFNNVIKAIKSKTPIYIIAKNHKRTVGAIKFKLIRHVATIIEETDNDLTLEEMKEITNLSKEDLINGFKKIKFDYKIIEEIPVEENKRSISTFTVSIVILNILFAGFIISESLSLTDYC
jgi:hypothetical protein